MRLRHKYAASRVEGLGFLLCSSALSGTARLAAASLIMAAAISTVDRCA